MIRLSGICVSYGAVRALSGVDFAAQPGEVVGLLGDTGAGKSTLLQVISGAVRPSAGAIELRGGRVELRSPADAERLGVHMLYQDLALVDAHDVATNLVLGREPVRAGLLGRLGVLDRGALRRQAHAELTALGVELPVRRPVELLSGGQRQLVALARAAMRASEGDLLLLDEPTAALSDAQAGRLPDLVARLSARGVAVVVATHNLPLCFEIAQRIVVLERGRKVADVAVAETDQAAVVGWITGAR